MLYSHKGLKCFAALVPYCTGVRDITATVYQCSPYLFRISRNPLSLFVLAWMAIEDQSMLGRDTKLLLRRWSRSVLLSPPRSILWQKAWHSSKYSPYLLFFTTTTSTSYSDAWYRRQQDLSIHRYTPHCLQAVWTCRGRVVGLALPETSLKTCLVKAFFLSLWTHPPLCFLP